MTSSINPSAAQVMPTVVEAMPEGPEVPKVAPQTAPVEEKKPEKKKRKRGHNPWLEYVKVYRTEHPDLKFKEVLQAAKLTYTRIKKEKEEKS